MSAVMTDVSTGIVEKGISHDSRIYLSSVKSLKNVWVTRSFLCLINPCSLTPGP